MGFAAFLGLAAWELVFSRFVPSTDPNDGAPVPSGVLANPSYEFAFGIVADAALIPITAPAIIAIGLLDSAGDYAGMAFTPDGVALVGFNGTRYTTLQSGVKLPPFPFPIGADSGSSISYDPVTKGFSTAYGDSGAKNAYFVIVRRLRP